MSKQQTILERALEVGEELNAVNPPATPTQLSALGDSALALACEERFQAERKAEIKVVVRLEEMIGEAEARLEARVEELEGRLQFQASVMEDLEELFRQNVQALEARLNDLAAHTAPSLGLTSSTVNITTEEMEEMRRDGRLSYTSDD